MGNKAEKNDNFLDTFYERRINVFQSSRLLPAMELIIDKLNDREYNQKIFEIEKDVWRNTFLLYLPEIERKQDEEFSIETDGASVTLFYGGSFCFSIVATEFNSVILARRSISYKGEVDGFFLASTLLKNMRPHEVLIRITVKPYKLGRAFRSGEVTLLEKFERFLNDDNIPKELKSI